MNATQRRLSANQAAAWTAIVLFPVPADLRDQCVRPRAAIVAADGEQLQVEFSEGGHGGSRVAEE